MVSIIVLLLFFRQNRSNEKKKKTWTFLCKLIPINLDNRKSLWFWIPGWKKYSDKLIARWWKKGLPSALYPGYLDSGWFFFFFNTELIHFYTLHITVNVVFDYISQTKDFTRKIININDKNLSKIGMRLRSNMFFLIQ